MDTGTRLGPYEILTKIGEGGMGAVYKARDTRLDRTVAIKRSAEAFNERFEREAQAIAALNHPNICTLFDVGPDYLVMELVDGKPLSGPVPVDEAIRYAIQIASALDAAHRRGITHRDLKPANILITKAGVKLLDFGLAKLVKPVVDRDATQVMGMTQPGMIMGTPQYMSPEQVEAQEADARSDIFSFGVILYELITGRKAFEGKTMASVMASVLREQPLSMTTLVPVTPPALERIVKRCLEKDPDNRFQTARDVMHSLEDLALPETELKSHSSSPRKWQAALALALVALSALGIAYWQRPAATMPVYSLAINPPPGLEFVFGPNGQSSAISPDEKHLAFCAANALWVRSLDSGVARKLPGTDDSVTPFWSPDSKSIGFGTASKQTLRSIELTSLSIQELAKNYSFRGASWSANGGILYVGDDFTIYYIPGSTGAPHRITTLDSARHEDRHYWPHFLPDGDHFLFLIRSSAEGMDGLHVGSIKQPGLRHRISNAPSNGTFVPASNGHPGYVLFARDGNLFAQPFNAVNFTSQGEVITVSPVGNDPRIGQGNFSSGPTSIVLGGKGVPRSQLAWFNREGKQLGPAIAEGILGEHRISPDGSRLMLRTITNNSSSLSMMEFSRGVLSLVSPVGAAPAWAADSKEIIYSGTGKVFRKKIDGNGPGEELFPLKSTFPVLDWSPDGKSILAAGNLVRLDKNPPETKSFESGTSCRKFSPNGRFIACVVSEQGIAQIVVQSFPDLKNRWQVSSKGGDVPRWRRDGKELFYIDGLNKLMSVTVRPNGDGLAFDTPKLLFAFDPVSGGSLDAAPDGQKFLITTPLDSGPEGSELTILTNWRDGPKLKK